ncbi:MAG TPA: hypothetical protein VLB44_10575 [Kofleriaceae bacterium]|nr:hypothetical protein [Kofleriaceae bacterium]
MKIHAEELATISLDQLDDVTGGGWAGDAWNWVKDTAGSLFGGEGQGTNISLQNGNNQRSAQGNTAPVSLGDNSPITVK